MGPYEILEEVGRGGMGAVYKARDPRTGRKVAIKVLLKGRNSDPLTRKRFEREARALAKVDHPHVVRLLDLGEDRGSPYLVLEFHTQGSLEEALKAKPLDPLMAIHLGIQLAAGLEAAHACGVLHRDLKPENVLYGADGFAMLTDFGLAKDLNREGETQRLTESGIFLGTPGYWAPEQATGKTEKCGPATDAYGLGAVLYAALCGRPPVLGEGLIAILKATVDERPPALRSMRPDVSRDLESVVMRCLEKEPSARWASAGELKRALTACLGSAQEHRLSRSKWRLPLALGGVAIALGVVSVVIQLRAALSPIAPAPTPSAVASRGAAPRVARQPSGEPRRTTPSGPDALLENAKAAAAEGRMKDCAALIRQAADKGHGPAMVTMGRMLEAGRGVAEDPGQAAKWYRRAAELGNKDGMNRLGRMQALGLGLAKNLEQAAMWYRRSAEMGVPESMDALALLLRTGQGVPFNEVEARRWYRRAAEKGYAPAMTSLGFALQAGHGGNQDEEEAAQWFRRAAEKGHPDGMDNLGIMLETGRGVAKDQARAVYWFRCAAELGSLAGMTHLGTMLRNGHGVARDDTQAARWFHKAATGGHADAMQNMGKMHRQGTGVVKDEKVAVRWFRLAAQRGDLEGMSNLGYMLARGKGVEADEAKAVQWYRKAVAKGHAASMVRLGNMLATGRGVAADRGKAAEWYRRALKSGDASARQAGLAALEVLAR
jgi:TPR repeat protein/serine/threonine protein kinase